MDEIAFITLAAFVTHRKDNYDTNAAKAQFRLSFGVSADLTSILWGVIVMEHIHKFDVAVKPVHLLWTLLFLKQYMTGQMQEAVIGKTRKTIMKYVWAVVAVMAGMANDMVSHRCCLSSLSDRSVEGLLSIRPLSMNI